MGLIDLLNEIQGNSRGKPDPGAGGSNISPIATAILGLLANQALQGFTGGQPSAQPASTPTTPANRSLNAGRQGTGGGLDDLLGGLGGLLAGGAAGSTLSGGLGSLLNQLQQGGQAETAASWVGTGPNMEIAPNDLAGALGADRIDALAVQSGMKRDELLQGLSRYLPQVVDRLTPNGRVPTEQEVSRLI